MPWSGSGDPGAAQGNPTTAASTASAAAPTATAAASAAHHGADRPDDGINLSQAAVYNSPGDIASWPITAALTRIDMSSAGLALDFTTKQSWPDVTPPGWDGPLEYTVWAVVNINGRWNTSGFIQMWRGRVSTGAPILSDFATNWAYDSRWGPMAAGYHPHVGELMGFFVSAGNARGETGVSSRRERSNVVVVALPAGDQGSFAFSLGSMPLSQPATTGRTAATRR
jgi:hypothetical protein